MSNWNTENIPDQKGRVAIITGATSGLGKEVSSVLASKNATVVMAVRNTEKAKDVVKEIQQAYPHANIDIRKLELDSLDSVKNFTAAFLKDYNRLDLLINNAGVMACPYSTTKDGFEIQMGVNHFSHFALTGLLMPLVLSTEGARVVATSSIAHTTGNINFDDINWEKRPYKTGKAYSDSKLANLYFIYELVKKFEGVKNAPLFVAAHPGWTKTELDRHSKLIIFLSNVLAQKVNMGALPTLRAAFDEQAKAGDYFGPSFWGLRGKPVLVKSNARSHNMENAKKLWEISEKLTGVKY